MNSETANATKQFQRESGLTDDGNPGPRTRAKLFLAYMNFLCPDQLDSMDFLARGADPGGKGDLQGCGEFNPIMAFSSDEEKYFSKPENREARNAANAVNRRVVILLFRPGSFVQPEKWPCPRKSEGVEGCQKRFWSDSQIRRAPADDRREFGHTEDTFACRFYHRMTTLSPCEKVPLRIIVDYEFRHVGSDTHLLFTVRGDVPPKLFVRLYECTNQADASQREEWIRSHAESFGDKAGFEKSGRYHEVAKEDLASIAAKYGYTGVGDIENHFENAGLKTLRDGSLSLETGDSIYIPQLLETAGAIPLGPLLEAAPADEAASNGMRFAAVWKIDRWGYDPLDWDAWTPECRSSIQSLRLLDFDSGRADRSLFYMPQFAVIAPDFQVLGVSPTPMWLVHKAKFEAPAESESFRVFLAEGTSKEVDGSKGRANFEGAEDPMTFFGALPAEGTA